MYAVLTVQHLHLLSRYFFSTLLSLWNRTLLGKGHGVLGKGAFPGVQRLLHLHVFIRWQEVLT